MPTPFLQPHNRPGASDAPGSPESPDRAELADSDTIAAISTAAGAAAIGIVRMSGQEAIRVAERVFRSPQGVSLDGARSHSLVYGRVVDPEHGHAVDEVLAAVMRAPTTYTTEDIVEFHCHGGPAAQRAVLRILLRYGVRPADPGEFTRRAFLGGRIDLAQAEAVGEIVQAKSAGSLRAAVHQLEGGLSERLRELRTRLVGVLARMETTIDFSDEDIEILDRADIERELSEVAVQLKRLLETAFLGRVLENGLSTAIVGKPNVGKSSLLNAILMRERAIVSDLPGTTRDTVEELIEWEGIPLRLVDTAGLRAGGGQVERLGVERSRKALASADLALAVFDVTEHLDEEDRLLLEGLDPRRTILVANKVDLLGRGGEEPDDDRGSGREAYEDAGYGPAADGNVGSRPEADGTSGSRPAADGRMTSGRRLLEAGLQRWSFACKSWMIVPVSAQTGEGLEELRRRVDRMAGGDAGLDLDEPILATERQRLRVEEAAAAVEAARAAVQNRLPDELACEDVRRSSLAIGRITGEDLVGDLLDEIFSKFCIGK